MMYRVQQNHLRTLSKEEYLILKKLTRWSKNVYNHTLWLMKEEWKKKRNFLAYNKKNCSLGKRTTQNFHYITYGLFKHKLRTKSELYGIEYKEINEAYTSQTCSQCGQIRKANRKYRGLYVCKNCGTVLNADVNGALNILKKVAPESSLLKIGGSGCMSRPSRRSVVSQHSHV